MSHLHDDSWSAAGIRFRSVARSWVLAASVGVVSVGPAAAAEPVDFSREIRPILSGKCYHCHGPDPESRKAGLRLDLREEAVKARKNGPALVPGKSADSPLLHRILSKDPDEVMPPPETGHTLSREEIRLMERWIGEGAPYAGHWAFTAPVRPPLPGSGKGHPVDRFIESRLSKEGLALSGMADRATLLRRLSLDLVGLPPTPVEIDAFEADRSAAALEKVVDRLLASPHFGERWARPWLDVARYADSAGLGSDPLRLNIWPYRDWLISALNRNLPFDEFTRQQIAGDLLPDAGEEQRMATAFHRNTMTNTEGGTDDEEWRVAAVKDRANVTMQAWMGLTFGCAQCHTHKFDPITHREYYSLFAFFNQTADNDQPDERPTMPYFSAAERAERERIQRRIDTLQERFQASDDGYAEELAAWSAEAAKPSSWVPLTPESAVSTSTNGSTLRILADASVLAEGEGPERDGYRIRVRGVPDGITAFRLEALTDTSLPKGGPGRAVGEGNFVLTDFRVQVLPRKARSATARFVRVEAPGEGRILSLAEVQVFSGGANVAASGKARQSSTGYLGDAGRAIDGNTDGNYDAARSTTHTDTESNPWWELDLGREMPVEELAVWNRTDGSGERLAKTRVLLLDAGRQSVWEGAIASAPMPVLRTGPSAATGVLLQEATADHAQGGFPAANAIDGDPGRKSGWAVGGRLGMSHALVVQTAKPLRVAESDVVEFTLNHAFGDRQTLGRFRVSATTRPGPVRELPESVAKVVVKPVAEWTAEERAEVERHHRPMSRSKGGLAAEIQGLRTALAAIRGVPLPVMQELPSDKHRVTRLMNKGNFLDPGEVVPAAVPASFHPMSPASPTNRLGLAAWLTDRRNPLTARVAVNRYWSALFGTGLVETEEDFGTQGSLPSHPELLDWLAVEFMEPSDPGARAWDVKRLLKTIVTSRTYLQTSTVLEASRNKDPRNRLLSHFPRRRLDAEMVRDQALAVSGLLSGKIGGASVYPPQPDGLWRAAFNGERSYEVSPGEDRFRRGLYTIWRRTAPNPSMSTFDAPSRETCTFRRQPTNTPLQAYVTLNDPVFVEAAQALARRILGEGGTSDAERIRFGYRLATGRRPDAKEVGELEALLGSMRSDFHGRPEDAAAFASKPLGPLPPAVPASEAAAWTAVANVLLNLDATLTRG
jgi:hypothetical protein